MQIRDLELRVARIIGYQVVQVPHHDGHIRYRLVSPEGKQFPIRKEAYRAWQDAPRYIRSDVSFMPLLKDYLKRRPHIYTVSMAYSHTGCTMYLHWWLDDRMPVDAGPCRDRAMAERECGITTVSTPSPGQSLCELILVLEAIYGTVSLDDALSGFEQYYRQERQDQIEKWRGKLKEWEQGLPRQQAV